MSEQHTPGPWCVVRDESGVPLAIVPGGPNRTTVACNCPECARAGQRSYDELVTCDSHVYGPPLQDAFLMAAAPDLYEALVMVRDADEDCRRDGLRTIPPLPRRKIDDAIAKAEGAK